MIDLDELERLAKGSMLMADPDEDGCGTYDILGVSRFQQAMDPATILALTAEVRRLRNLLDNRPAVNAALVAEFMKWTAVVYDSDIASARAGVKS